MSQTPSTTPGPQALSTSTPAPGFLLSWPTLVGMAALLGLAMWFDQGILVAPLALLLVTAAIARLWSRYALRGLRLDRRLTHSRAFPGEAIELRLRLENRKPLPLPWVDVVEGVPPALLPEPQATPPAHTTALLWYQAVTWRRQLLCHKRGYYPLRPARAISGDPFGLYPREADLGNADHILVYPRIFPISDLGLPASFPMGEITTPWRPVQDPLRFMGVRDYTPHDPLRHIHWKATARHGQPQVRVFESTATLKALVLLAVDSYATTPDDDLEFAFSTAASVAYHLTQGRSSVGLLANTTLQVQGGPAVLPARSGWDHLMRLLEALALATPRPFAPFGAFLQAHRADFPAGATLVVIHHQPDPVLLATLQTLRRAGFPVALLTTGPGSEPLAGSGIATWPLRRLQAATSGRPS